MIKAQDILALAGSLGTPEGLLRVNDAIESFAASLSDHPQRLSRVELLEMRCALDSLSIAIATMDRVTREMLGESLTGTVNCVG